MGVAIPTQSDARKIQGKTVTAPTALDDGKALVFDLPEDKYKHQMIIGGVGTGVLVLDRAPVATDGNDGDICIQLL